jgi:uncharacterized repeat protein (TIGR04076 family)
MNKVKITVLETTFNERLAKEYGVEGLGLCPFHKKDEVFYADFSKPEGLCDEAWKAIYQYAFALSHGVGSDGKLLYFEDWVKTPGVAIVCCNDGIRPVIFKLEATSESSKL